MHTMDRVPAVVGVRVIYFAVQAEPAPGNSVGHAPGQRAEVAAIVLVAKDQHSVITTSNDVIQEKHECMKHVIERDSEILRNTQRGCLYPAQHRPSSLQNNLCKSSHRAHCTNTIFCNKWLSPLNLKILPMGLETLPTIYSYGHWSS